MHINPVDRLQSHAPPPLMSSAAGGGGGGFDSPHHQLSPEEKTGRGYGSDVYGTPILDDIQSERLVTRRSIDSNLYCALLVDITLLGWCRRDVLPLFVA